MSISLKIIFLHCILGINSEFDDFYSYFGESTKTVDSHFETGENEIRPNIFCKDLSQNESLKWKEKHNSCQRGASRIYGGTLADTVGAWPYLAAISAVDKKGYNNNNNTIL